MRPETTQCLVCGCPLPIGRRGPIKRYCRPHADPVQRARAARLGPANPSCRGCGVPIEQPRSGRRIYCSVLCRNADRPPTPAATTICAECGLTFTSQGQTRRTRFCSKACSVRHHVRERYNRERAGSLTTQRAIARTTIGDRDGWICHICREPIDRTRRYPDPGSPSLDHYFPLACGGIHDAWNVAISHVGCNMARRLGGMTPDHEQPRSADGRFSA